MMSDPIISVIIPCHDETKWLERAAKSVLMQVESPDFELIVMPDRATPETFDTIKQVIKNDKAKFCHANFGDLGLTRNSGMSLAKGRFIAFLDADDVFGAKWLRQAFEHARRFDNDDFILHPEWSIMFGTMNFVHRHFGGDNPCFDERDLIQHNPWSALAFGPKSVFERFPYETADGGFGYEDWHFNTRTLGAGIKHECVKEAVHFIRMKQDETSLAKRTSQTRAAIRAMPMFNKRNLRPAQHIPPQGEIPESVYKQALFAHHEVGEKRIFMDQTMSLRVYPRQTIFDDHAWLRDQIGDSKHVVLVRQLIAGGAEKYGLDWCEALKDAGLDPVIIETEAVESGIWRARAERVARLVPWFKRHHLQPHEAALALQRALIQSELESLFICNAPIGWAMAGENAKVLAKRVIAASFSEILLETGFTTCPPYHLKAGTTLELVTDNERHASRLRSYGTIPVTVIEPKCVVNGGPSCSQIKDKKRILWAGRGTEEKRPHLAMMIAARLPDVDVHIWGDVPKYAHNLPNVKHRGKFDRFDQIDGSYDFYLLTSITEGMPNTAIEAIMCGLPVVSSDVGDLKRVSAITFETDNKKSIEVHADNGAAAIKAWYAEAGKGYDHSGPLEIVNGWADKFKGKVLKLVNG